MAVWHLNQDNESVDQLFEIIRWAELIMFILKQFQDKGLDNPKIYYSMNLKMRYNDKSNDAVKNMVFEPGRWQSHNIDNIAKPLKNM